MLTVEGRMELAVLRKHGAGILELARVTGHSRNTVRRYLRGGGAATVRKPAPKRAEKLDRFKAYIVDRVRRRRRIGFRRSFCFARFRRAATTAARRG